MENPFQRPVVPALYPQNPETILRYISVEIQTDNTTGRYTFPNNNELNGVRILSISFPRNEDDDMIAPSGRDVVSNAVIGATYVEIRRDSDNIIYQTPARFLQETEGDRSIRPVNIKGFNPSTSFLVVANAGLIDTSESFVVTVLYTDK